MLTAATRRRDFPSLEGMTYLNTAAEGVPPLAVREALDQYFRDKQLGMDGRPLHAAQWEAVRALAGEFLGLSAAEVGVCSCSSEAYNLAALALRLRDGDEVVINDLDFPAGATPWLQPTCPADVRGSGRAAAGRCGRKTSPRCSARGRGSSPCRWSASSTGSRCGCRK
jgi:cysteine desulfurase/selenocysteine lyase